MVNPVIVGAGSHNTLFMNPFTLPGTLNASSIKFMLNCASTSSATGGFSWYGGFYYQDGSSLVLASSISSTWSWTSSTPASGWGGYSGNRFYEAAISMNFTPGNWWAGSVIRTASNIAFSQYGYSLASVVSLQAKPAGATTANSYPNLSNAHLAYMGISNAAWTATSMPANIVSNETGFVYNSISARRQWFLLTTI
jgi:hypothetical protein